MRKRLKSSRIISVILCVLLIAAMIPSAVFAESGDLKTTPSFSYVALGDAATLGYGMDTKADYGVLTEGTYPALLAEKLKAKGLSVNVSQMGMKGMRMEELRYLLDSSYSGDAYLNDNFPSLAQKRSEYLNAVKDADLITVSLGTVNFGSYFLYIAGDVDKRCDDNAVKAMVTADSLGIRASLANAADEQINKIPATVRTQMEDMINQFKDSYVNAGAYAFYSFKSSYDKSIDRIHEINPNADIIVLGIHNMLRGFTAGVMDVNFEIGALYNEQLVVKANNQLKGKDGIYGFVDMTSINRFFDEVAAYDDDPTHITQQFKDYCDVYEDDLGMKSEVQKHVTDKNKKNEARALNAAYDTVAQSLKSVAGIKSESFDLGDLLYLKEYLKDHMDGISTMGSTLMAGLKAKGIDLAVRSLEKITVYTSELNSFINYNKFKPTEPRYGDFYGVISTKDDLPMKKLGHIVMAIGLSAKMGDGFFQQPSAQGHSQIATKVYELYQTIHFEKRDPSCEKTGNDEFWFKVSTGKCYSNEACTAEVSPDSVLKPAKGHQYQEVPGTAKKASCTEAGKEADKKCSVCNKEEIGKEIPPLGHDYGPEVIVVKPGVGKDGRKECTCSRCSDVKVTVIPGYGPANTKITKLKAAKKGFTATWKLPSKANLKNTTGYEIRYSLKSSMASAKTVRITKNKTTSKAIKKLKAKKKYYVQIRTYKKSSGKKYYYSKWSAKKSVKTK